MNLEELREKISDLINEYERDTGDSWEYDDDYPDYLFEAPTGAIVRSTPEQYFSLALMEYLLDKGSIQEAFRDCSIYLYGCKEGSEYEVELARNEFANIDRPMQIDVNCSGTMSVMEIVSNDDSSLFFNCTVGVYAHPVAVPSTQLAPGHSFTIEQLFVSAE